jgi:hypothetical protein
MEKKFNWTNIIIYSLLALGAVAMAACLVRVVADVYDYFNK